MAVNPMISAGVNGIQSGMKRFETAAQDVVEFSLPSTDGPGAEQGARLDDGADAAEALVDLRTYQRQVQASAKVVQTADEMIGFLLDVV